MAEEYTLNQLLKKTVSERKNDIAVISQEKENYKEYSCGDIYKRIRKTASFFQKEGIDRGSHCLLLLENRLEWLVAYFALVYNGAVCVPLNPELRAKDVLNLAKDCGAKNIISSQKLYQEKLKEQEKGLPRMILVDISQEKEGIVPFEKAFDFPERSTPEPVSPEQIASLIYTSGTTGSPKGVLLTNRNLVSNFQSIAELKIIRASDNILALLPLYHVYPFMVTLILPFLTGAKITYFPVSFRKEVLLKVIKECSVTVLVAIPQFYQKLYAGISKKLAAIPALVRPLLFPLAKKKIKKGLGKDLRLLTSGGARLDKQVAEGFQKLGFNLLEGYGLTETSPIVTFNPLGKVKFGSVGTPIPHVELRIDNPNHSGVGEICVKGPNVMKGYYKRPDLTAEVIRDGWFHTGDLGYIDRDGYLFITGRKKEVIVLSSGKNVYPQDVEEVYLESPYIKEICVMAGEEADEAREFLFAVVVPDMEYCRRKGEADIKGKIRWQIEEVSTGLPIYQRVQSFAITQDELPKTALGKMERYKIKEKYLDKKEAVREEKKSWLEDDPDITEKEKARSILDFFSKVLKKEVSLDDHIELDLGVDSLGRVELATEIESRFSLQLPEDFFLKVSTIKEIVLEILTSRKEKKGESLSGGDWKHILGKEPSSELKRKVKIETNFFDILVTYSIKVLFACFFKIFLRFKVEGKENIPRQKPFIICANHVSYFDGFLIFAANLFKDSTETFFIGYREIFELPIFRWAIRFARLIPIEATGSLLDSMRVASYVLRNQKIICLFPEGERTPEGKLREFKKGIGILLKELDVAVLPAYIEGAFESWPRGRFLPKPYPVKVNFGKAVDARQLLSDYQGQDKDEYARISQALRRQIEKIKEKTKND